jgi:hypothetical protein
VHEPSLSPRSPVLKQRFLLPKAAVPLLHCAVVRSGDRLLSD